MRVQQAHEDVEKVQLTSSKISQRFAQIEGADLGDLEPAPQLRIVDLREDKG